MKNIIVDILTIAVGTCTLQASKFLLVDKKSRFYSALCRSDKNMIVGILVILFLVMAFKIGQFNEPNGQSGEGLFNWALCGGAIFVGIPGESLLRLSQEKKSRLRSIAFETLLGSVLFILGAIVSSTFWFIIRYAGW